MKSTNVRQLMNLLSQKYFGNDLTTTSSKVERSTMKTYSKNDESTLSIVSPVTSCKTSPKYNRTSSTQAKRHQNFNFFQESRNPTEEIRNKPKRTGNSFFKNNQKKQLEIKDIIVENGKEQIDSRDNLGLKQRKYSQKDLIGLNDSNVYLSPVTFGHLNSTEIKNTNSRLVKQSIKETKDLSRKLFLKQNSSELNQIESNSTVSISNSRSSYILRKQERQLLEKRRIETRNGEQQIKKEGELQFFKQKCSQLEQQNSELKEKILTYEEQFTEEKILVENLKNMISKREQQVNQIIDERLVTFQRKSKLFDTLQADNQTLKNQLEQVRTLLRQQESIIIELYTKNKQKLQQSGQKPTTINPINNGTNTLTSLTSNCSSSYSNQSQQYAAVYLDNRQRKSIEQSQFEEQ